MSLHPQAALLLTELRKNVPIERRNLPEVRAAGRTPATVREPMTEVSQLDAGSIRARLYRPTMLADLGLLVYFHGGGWLVGSVDTHDDACRRLANAAGMAVISVEYRLAPENPFPAAVDDALATTHWAYEHAEQLRCRPDFVGVAGDSAGGNLAAVVAQRSTAPLALQLLVCPILDCARSMPSHKSFAEDYFLTSTTLTWFMDNYLSGGGSVTDPDVSPLVAPDERLRTSPPALIITAQFDPLRDEGQAYAGRLNAVGVPATNVCFGGQFHGFWSFAQQLDDGRLAIALAGAWARQLMQQKDRRGSISAGETNG